MCTYGIMWVYKRLCIENLSHKAWGRSFHCKVEQPRANILHVKNLTFYIKHHQNGSKFYQMFFMSRYTWYLLYRIKIVTKYDDLFFP